ncbi:hypothetical protein ACGFYQ_11595 [Streptomyces sp. NPDC048258]|uniref:hypothetical protein n=1 Tax=Streptomyces sp. NPDC048258 TaxID=3365527 RepID=UPI003719C647
MEGLGDAERDAEGGTERELVGGGVCDEGADFDGGTGTPVRVGIDKGVALGAGLGAELGPGMTDGDSVGHGVGVGDPISGGAAGGAGRTADGSGASTR